MNIYSYVKILDIITSICVLLLYGVGTYNSRGKAKLLDPLQRASGIRSTVIQ